MGSNFGNTVLTNIGSMENKGVEFNLNFIPVQTKDWNLTVGFNGTFQHTEFTKLNNTDDPDYAIQHHQGHGQPAPDPQGRLCALHFLLFPAGIRPGRQSDPERAGRP